MTRSMRVLLAVFVLAVFSGLVIAQVEEVLVAQPAGPAPAVEKGGIVNFSGTVQLVDGKPVPGVTITINYAVRSSFVTSFGGDRREVSTAKSDAKGRFTLVLVDSPMWARLVVEAPAPSKLGLLEISPSLRRAQSSLSSGVGADVVIRMKEGPCVLSGKVAGESGAPAKGAVVTITRTDGLDSYSGLTAGQPLSATTGADGVYRFQNLLPGNYRVESVIPDRASGLVPVPGNQWHPFLFLRVLSAMPVTKDFTLPPGGSIRGRVVDEAGKPVAGAKVHAGLARATLDDAAHSHYQKTGNFNDDTTADKDGRYTLVGLTPETYQVWAEGPEGSGPEVYQVWAESPKGPGFAPSGVLTGMLVEAGWSVTAQDIPLAPGGTLEGKVTGADGKPVADVAIVYGWRITKTDTKGQYRFASLATGASDLRLVPPAGSVWAGRTVERVPCVAKVNAVADWKLDEGGVLSGRVTGEGHPVAGARIWAGFSDHNYKTVTDKDGNYRLVGLVENSGLDWSTKPWIYNLSVSPPDDSPYMGTGVKFDIRLGEKIEDDIVLMPGAAVAGKVTTEDGQPVAGASISVFQDLGSGARSTFAGETQGMGHAILTAADGTFAVRQLPSQTMSVSAESPEGANLLPAERRGVAFKTDEPAEVTLVMKTGGSITGTLVDASGKPVGEADVRITARDVRRLPWGFQAKPTVTDEKGRFTFDGLPANGFFIETTIYDGRLVAPSESADVAEGKDTPVKIVAVVGGFIEVTVAGPDGKPLLSANVSAALKGESGKHLGSTYAKFDKPGLYVVGPVAPGRYDVSVMAWSMEKRYKQASVNDVEVKSGERVRPTVTLEELPAQPAPGPRQPKPGVGG